MKKNLGQLLIEQNLIDEKTLSEALQRQVIFGGRLGTNLLEMKAITEIALLKVLSHTFKIPYANPDLFSKIPEDVIALIPRELLSENKMIPIAAQNHRITLAMADPQKLDIVDRVAFHTNMAVDPVVASELRIIDALERYLGIRREARFISVVTEKWEAQPEHPADPDPEEDPDLLILTEDDIEPLDPYEVVGINKAFSNIHNRDEVAQTVIRASLRFMEDVFMFILKGEKALGWMSGGTAKPVVDFGNLSIPLDSNNILYQIKGSRTLERLEGVKVFESNQWLKELSLKVPGEVIICPLLVRKHVVSVLLGFSFNNSIDEMDAEFLVRVMQKASVAFEILIMRSRIIML